MSAAVRPLTVGIVGAGRVGGVLGVALRRAGHTIVAASGGTPGLLDVPRTTPEAVISARPDLLLLAVPDDVLDRVAAAVPAVDGQVVAHTCGAHGLKPTVQVALHPAMTFTGSDADLDRLPGIAWGVTTTDRDAAERLVADLKGVPEWIAEGQRPLYHAALAHGANHLVTLVNDAADALRAAGVADPANVLRPLLAAALDNALTSGDAALTGPVQRGDAGTVERHLAALPAEIGVPYRALARRTVQRAGLAPTAAAALERSLA
jgi:predicted short-subunit dehydrogenase-like oxidoreductase (DUF2520 family)